MVKGEPFLQRWPERVIEAGIAEANGVAMAAGLASAGLRPFLCTYAGFLTMRACEQMRTFVAYPRMKVRFVGVNAGLFGGNREGVSHQFIEDIGIMRTIPGFTILCPADGDQVKQAVMASVDIEGPVYIRIGSGREERVFPDGTPFEIGKIRVLRENGTDVALLLPRFRHQSGDRGRRRALPRGHRRHRRRSPYLKPLDTEGISAALARCGRAVTVEDHNVIGGLGSAIAEVIAEGETGARLIRLGLQDRYGESGFPTSFSTSTECPCPRSRRRRGKLISNRK